MAFKRKRSSALGTSKRRRFTGRFTGRRRRFGRRVQTLSGQLGSIRSQGFRSRRLSRRAWRNNLWRSTLAEPHWRTDFVQAATIPVPAAVEACSVVTVQALGNDFWTVGGGALPLDLAVPVPEFVGNITLRGGVSTISFSNPNNADTADAVKVRLWMIWTAKEPVLGILPSTANAGFDPSLVPDFERFGRIIGSREFWLLPGNKPMEVKYRYRPHKIDQVIHNNDGQQLYWMFTVSGHQVGAESIVLKAYYNASFSADAIQPTPAPLTLATPGTQSLPSKKLVRNT